jgi:hypothetical protein
MPESIQFTAVELNQAIHNNTKNLLKIKVS